MLIRNCFPEAGRVGLVQNPSSLPSQMSVISPALQDEGSSSRGISRGCSEAGWEGISRSEDVVLRLAHTCITAPGRSGVEGWSGKQVTVCVTLRLGQGCRHSFDMVHQPINIYCTTPSTENHAVNIWGKDQKKKDMAVSLEEK